MKRIATICLIIAALLMMAAPVAFASTVDWRGLTWTIRGAANSAVVDVNEYLSITVLGGNSGDPAPDNWAVYAKNFMPASSSSWMQFTFTDPGGSSGPRAYAEAKGTTSFEMLMQGGVIPPNLRTYTNMHVWADDDWAFGNWNYPYTNRPVGDHTFKVGLGSNGEVDFFYDGNLIKAYRVGQYYPVWNGSVYEDVQFTWNANYFNYAYLGVDTAVASNATIIYKDFQYGTSYTPVPLPGTLVLLGSGLAGLAFYRRRRATLKD
jgi:hypothetical protein